MTKFKKGDRIRNIYNGQRFLVIDSNTNTFSDGYYIIKGESYPHKDKKWMLFFDAENEWRLIRNNNHIRNKDMNVNDVIDFLRTAKNKTYSSEDRYRLNEAIDVLYNMKDCNCFKD